MIDRFDVIFESLTKQSQGQSMVTELYNILPFLKEEELKNIVLIKQISNKYNLKAYEDFIIQYMDMKKRNKSLGLINSFTKMLKYVSLEEKFRGIKINSQGGNNDNM